MLKLLFPYFSKNRYLAANAVSAGTSLSLLTLIVACIKIVVI